MIFGLRCSGAACRPHPASLPVRVPAVESLLSASFSFASRLRLAFSLRLPSSAPIGSFHPIRFCPCWAHPATGFRARRNGHAGQRVLFLRLGQPCSHRVLKSVFHNALELVLFADEVIVALALPEWLPGQAKQLVRLPIPGAFSLRSTIEGSMLGVSSRCTWLGQSPGAPLRIESLTACATSRIRR